MDSLSVPWDWSPISRVVACARLFLGSRLVFLKPRCFGRQRTVYRDDHMGVWPNIYRISWPTHRGTVLSRLFIAKTQGVWEMGSFAKRGFVLCIPFLAATLLCDHCHRNVAIRVLCLVEKERVLGDRRPLLSEYIRLVDGAYPETFYFYTVGATRRR